MSIQQSTWQRQWIPYWNVRRPTYREIKENSLKISFRSQIAVCCRGTNLQLKLLTITKGYSSVLAAMLRTVMAILTRSMLFLICLYWENAHRSMALNKELSMNMMTQKTATNLSLKQRFSSGTSLVIVVCYLWKVFKNISRIRRSKKSCSSYFVFFEFCWKLWMKEFDVVTNEFF